VPLLLERELPALASPVPPSLVPQAA
jgi:hypothetical protein